MFLSVRDAHIHQLFKECLTHFDADPHCDSTWLCSGRFIRTKKQERTTREYHKNLTSLSRTWLPSNPMWKVSLSQKKTVWSLHTKRKTERDIKPLQIKMITSMNEYIKQRWIFSYHREEYAAKKARNIQPLWIGLFSQY